jgi:hypothetical protein
MRCHGFPLVLAVLAVRGKLNLAKFATVGLSSSRNWYLRLLFAHAEPGQNCACEYVAGNIPRPESGSKVAESAMIAGMLTHETNAPRSSAAPPQLFDPNCEVCREMGKRNVERVQDRREDFMSLLSLE